MAGAVKPLSWGMSTAAASAKAVSSRVSLTMSHARLIAFSCGRNSLGRAGCCARPAFAFFTATSSAAMAAMAAG